ncbi:tyrosine-type recombinase/integrase [Klebsiella variicola]|uniref:tyrosine-type recombinase/integrase n=1 Tax=Klebsiella variicola TaxID=244366 RepID=UPI0034DFC7EF
MSNTKVAHTSYTEKAGYVFRKRVKGGTLSISIQTKEALIAFRRSQAMQIRVLELEPLSLPFEALHLTMKNYRDDLVRNETLAALTASLTGQAPINTPVSVTEALSVPVETPAATAAHIELQTISEAVAGHTLESVKAEYISEKDRDWRTATKKAKVYSLDLFISFCATRSITTIEAVDKALISDFKLFLDEKYASAISSRQKHLDNVNAYFGFCCEQRDYLTRNPIKGMSYKNVKTVNKKEEISREDYDLLMSLPEIANDHKTRNIIAMFYHTGMRLNELAQITRSDYVEIDGVKCISVNDENGKSVKNESSIRNIPLNEALLSLGFWTKKTCFAMTSQQIDIALRRAFKKASLSRTSHCFRYSVSDRMREAGVADSIRAFVLGHTQKMITDRVYITKAPVAQMKAALDAAM